MCIVSVLGYGFAMGQLFYVRELAPNGPAMNCGEIQPGDRVLEVRIDFLNVHIDSTCFFIHGIVHDKLCTL